MGSTDRAGDGSSTGNAGSRHEGHAAWWTRTAARTGLRHHGDAALREHGAPGSRVGGPSRFRLGTDERFLPLDVVDRIALFSVLRTDLAVLLATRGEHEGDGHRAERGHSNDHAGRKAKSAPTPRRRRMQRNGALRVEISRRRLHTVVVRQRAAQVGRDPRLAARHAVARAPASTSRTIPNPEIATRCGASGRISVSGSKRGGSGGRLGRMPCRMSSSE